MNARVTTFIYCLGTTSMEGENAPINAMGVLSTLNPEYIPSTFSFSIILGIRGIDITSNHKLTLIFKEAIDEGENLVEAKDIPILAEQLQKADSNLPVDQRGIILGMDLRNVVFKQEGNYCTEVILDEEKLGVFDIYAKAKH